ncbi:hypothetical protein C5167_038512 [Papaver somniferum]|uniref:Ternary complex factor MIP1 leucine-zipper domain-containing protein n=1 Tax=Papaver somniferum TaxID=3469 RepID=A0A4Y7ICP9_PAPSO|nr:uncharacterized protein LOC113296724 isoform X1 [Papaver somniferum]RZC45570.1 hypothetical protein C5167_038512 [Papaver somniferum]
MINSRARTTVKITKPFVKIENEKQGKRLMEAEKPTLNRRLSRKERKIALQQDVDKLKKKLRHEENVHRALERAFTRPLGALPRLPPYLPQNTLELLAEVAVLEEEVVRLEEQVVNFRQGLYEEAVYVASSKRNVDAPAELCNSSRKYKKEQPKTISQGGDGNSPTLYTQSGSKASSSTHLASNVKSGHSHNQPALVKQPSRRFAPAVLSVAEEERGKENHSSINSSKNNKSLPSQPIQRIRTTGRSAPVESTSQEKHLVPLKLQLECRTIDRDSAKESCSVLPDQKNLGEKNRCPNKISEDIVKCLSAILLRMRTQKVKGSDSFEAEFRDPYGICKEFEKWDVGPYKHLRAIEASSVDPNPTPDSSILTQRLKLLLGKLRSADLRGLSHQQKLAFWINVYNSCMMNAFIEHGIPESPQMVIAMMQKAKINVGGQSLNAMIIEHFILRLPYHSKHTYSKDAKCNELISRTAFGLEWSEPLVTFALSCGSWSSPAVRVYSASEVENELETAKRDYLQAAVSITSSNKLVIPKLLDWYLLDFAKDMKSLLDWVALQLPNELRTKAVKCLERGRNEPLSQMVQVTPYEFNFRYLLHQ